MVILIVLGIVVLLIVAWSISVYNGLIRRRNGVENAFGAIDAVLKQRFDLLPNLAETVKRYAEHESSTLVGVAQMRGGKHSYNEMSTEEKSTFANQSLLGIRDFYAVAERYPDLKASPHFMHLQRTLNEQEEQIAAARRTYNSMVTDYNNAIQVFPSSIVAGVFRFGPKTVLLIPAEERVAPSLKSVFGSN